MFFCFVHIFMMELLEAGIRSDLGRQSVMAGQELVSPAQSSHSALLPFLLVNRLNRHCHCSTRVISSEPIP